MTNRSARTRYCKNRVVFSLFSDVQFRFPLLPLLAAEAENGASPTCLQIGTWNALVAG